MNVIFLDIDGVLNSDDYIANRGEQPVHAQEIDAWHIDPESVARLNAVVERTGAAVVLSSDWRKGPEKPGLERTAAALRSRGAAFDILDVTPVLSAEQRQRYGISWQGNYTPRAIEIQCWLDEHPQVSNFAIVDDEPDMAHLADHLVVTDSGQGLTDRECARLLKLLSMT